MKKQSPLKTVMKAIVLMVTGDFLAKGLLKLGGTDEIQIRH